MHLPGTRRPRRRPPWRRATGLLLRLTALVCLVGTALPLLQAPSRTLHVQLVDRWNPAPTRLLSVVPGSGSLTLTWEPSGEEVGAYGIWVDGSWWYDVNAPATSETIGGLTDGTAYEVAVTVVTWTYDHGPEWHESPLSNRITDVAGDLPPARPATPAASAAEASTTVTWARSTEDDVVQYVLLRSGGGATDVEVARVSQPASGSVSAVDRTGARGQAYTYAVKAVDARGHTSDASGSSSSVTAQNLLAPGAPSGLSASARNETVALTWTLGTESDIKEYRVSRDGAAVAVVTAPEHSFTDNGLVNGRQYTYAVQTADHGGNTSLTSATVRATPRDDAPPAVPTGLRATAGDGQVALAWTASPEQDLAGYDLFRDGVRVAGAVLGPGATSYTDSGLVADRTYSYALRARDADGNSSAMSPAVTATPYDHTPPAVPARPTATAGDGSVSLSWTAGRDADLASYQVLRDGAVIATVARRTLAHTDRSVRNGTPYSYALVAVDAHGNASAASAPPVSATPVDRTPPATPSGLTAARGDGRVTLSWSANGETDLASYQVLRNGVLVGTAPSSSSPGFVDTGLTNDTTYTYSLVARDTSGNSSPESSPGTSATPTDLTAPAAPRAVTLTPGDTVVELAWQASTEPDLAAYRVYRDGRLIATTPVVAAPGSTPTSYRDTGLTNGVQHRYSVAAVDTHGNESVRATDAATPVDSTAPDAPTALSATPGDRQLVLAWTPGASPDVVTHRVLRDGVEVAAVQAPDATFTDTGLANGRSYTYVVVAVDDSGNRSATASAGATTTATPRDTAAPAAPTAVSATAGDGTATVRWTAPSDGDLAVYRVQRLDGTVLATAPAGSTTVQLTGLPNGTAVTVVVVAVDSSSNASPASAQVTVTPAAPAPPGSAVPSQGAGQGGALAVSPDGRWLVVATAAPLAPSDTNSASELYLVDSTGAAAPHRVAPVSSAATAAETSTNASDVAVSADGRYVVLATTAVLSPRDSGGLLDVYRGDLSTTPTTWTLVSVPASGATSRTVAGTLLQTGTQVNATAPGLAVSADGSRVLFYSARDDLVSGDGNGVVDVFAKDLVGDDAELGPVTRVSTATGGGATSPLRTATGPALALTPDGRYAVFTAVASGVPQAVYRKDLTAAAGTAASATGPLVVVSSTPPVAATFGQQTTVAAYRDTGDVAISDDGRYVAFVSAAKLTSTTPTSTASTGLAYRKDLSTGAVVAMGTGQTTQWEHQVGLSPDGSYGAFSTTAALVPSDTNYHTDVYGRDLSSGGPGPLQLVTSDASGSAVASPSGPVSSAEYGRVRVLAGGTVVVVTHQPLVAGDTNRIRDVYRKHLGTGAVAPLVVL